MRPASCSEGAPGRLLDLEGSSVAGRGKPFRIDARDVGERGPLAQPGEEPVDVAVRALGEDLDAAVELVADPAREPQAAGLGGGRGAEAHSLDAAAHGRVEALHGCTRTDGSWCSVAAVGPSTGIERGSPGRPSARAAKSRTEPSGATSPVSSQRPSGERSGWPKRPGSASIELAASSAPTRKTTPLPGPAVTAA